MKHPANILTIFSPFYAVSSAGAGGFSSAEPTTATTDVLPIIESETTTPTQHEEIIDVYAPAGKLGMVVDTPGEGPPIIHAVKDTSPLAGKMLVGDRLVALDDVDVSTMTAVRVSKLLSRKSNNEFRKLTVVRMVTKD
jgi:C-terminal processing protease CtpA/Prc